MRMGSRLLLVTAIAAIAGPLPALAKKQDFINCDGLQAPKASGNGMRPPPNTPYMYNSQRFSIAACDAALADPLLLPSHTLRRASLLRARAIGHLSAGNADQTLADIDAAHEATRELFSDPMFARSMGVSFDLVRAAAWQRKGDFARARQLAQAAGDARPYSVSVQSLVASLLEATSGPGEDPSPYAKVIPLKPTAIKEEFYWLVEKHRFSQALQTYPRLGLEFPQLQPDPNGTRLINTSENINTLTTSMVLAMFAAYAHAATGNTDAAQSLLSDTKAKVEAALAPLSMLERVAYAKNLNLFGEKLALMVSGRIDITQGKAINVVKSLVGQQLPATPLTVELLTALKTALPAEQQDLAPDPAPMAAKVAENAKVSGLDISALKKHLPAAEFSNNATEYKKSKKSILNVLLSPSNYRPDGFRSKEDPETGVITVEFIGGSATPTTVDELTLLHAADLARQRGKTGFIIVSRSLYARTMTTTINGMSTSSAPAGYQATLDIRLIDADNLPADLQLEGDRVLDANKVYGALAPIYISPEDARSS